MPPPEPSSKARESPRSPWVGLAIGAGVVGLIWVARPVIASAAAPVLLTLLLVVALDPATSWLAKRRLPGGRYAAAGLLLLALGALVALAYWQAGGIVLRQALDLAGNLSAGFPAVWDRVEPGLTTLLRSAGLLGEGMDYTLLLDRFGGQLQSLLGAVLGALSSLAEALFVRPWRFIVVPFLAFHFLGDLPRLRKSAESLCPSAWREEAMWLGGEVARIVGMYLRGMMVVVLLATIVYTVAFTAMGIENAFFLGIVAGMGEAIPFIGSVISFLVVAMFSLAGSSGQVLHIALVYLLYSLFQAQVIAPKVMGDNLRIHPVVVLLAILVMEPLLGLPGLVVAAPTAALVRSIYLHWQRKRPTIWG